MRFFFSLLLFANNVFALLTNQNKVTSEFSENNAIIKPIKDSDSAIIDEVFSPKAQEIDHQDMENAGMNQRQQMPYFNYLEVDYTKSGSKKHKEDIDYIVSTTSEKLGGLTASLRKNGIDCQPTSQVTKLDVPFYIDSHNSPNKEVTYKPFFCEQIQNKYKCTQTLHIHCEKKSILWKDWQSHTLAVSGRELLSSGYSLFAPHYVARRVVEMKLISPNSYESFYNGITFNSIPGMKSFLVSRFGYNERGIGDNMKFSWSGGLDHISGKDYLWKTYHISYQYREGADICEKWSKDQWQEQCIFG